MKYACKRILMLLVTMVIVSLLAFAAFESDLTAVRRQIMLGTQATPERVAELRGGAGAGPPASRCGIWSGWRAFSPGTWGFLTVISQPVWELIAPKVVDYPVPEPSQLRC